MVEMKDEITDLESRVEREREAHDERDVLAENIAMLKKVQK